MPSASRPSSFADAAAQPKIPEGGRGVPAAFVVGDVHLVCDVGGDLDTGGIGGEDSATGHRSDFSERQERWEYHDAGMPAEGVGTVVKVEHMPDGSVEHGRTLDANPFGSAEQSTRRIGDESGRLDVSGQNVRELVGGAGDGNTEQVQHRIFGGLFRFGWEIVVRW